VETDAGHLARPSLPAAAVRANRDLVLVLTRREIAGRYRGSVLGHLWALANPLLLLGVYTLVFGVVLPARWPTAPDEGGMTAFALRLLTGLLLHGFLAESLARAPTLVVSQPNYVTKVVFPLEALGWVNMLTAAFHAAIGIALLVLVNAVWGTGLGVAQLALPLIVLPLAFAVLGLVWVLAALGVYVRDLAQGIGPVLTVLMFLGPVFYPRSAMPAAVQGWLLLNPVTVPVEQARRVLFEHAWPDWGMLGGYALASIVLFVAGRYVFHLLRNGFADVL
jgi:lipopolysaccharide transport system permease protein